MGGKVKGPEALEQATRDELNKLWSMPPNKSQEAIGFSRIATDIFSWEITSQRQKKQPLKALNTSPTRTPTAPTKPLILPLSRRPLILPPIKLPPRSVLCNTLAPFSTPLPRRIHKTNVRRQRQIAQEELVKEVVTHISKRGRTVYHKSRD
jgi:hypothetical protein